jgi:hypothetical protein
MGSVTNTFAHNCSTRNAAPQELHGLGTRTDHASIRAELHKRLFTWLRTRRTRTTVTNREVAQRTHTVQQRGSMIGVWQKPLSVTGP